jgi:crotonobetaine/carnitine-CoA ligase
MSPTGRDAWRWRVEQSADRPFLHHQGRTWTYSETDELAGRFAGVLAASGVGQGTRIMVGLSNRPETLILMIATLRLGAVAVPLQGGLTFAELAYQIRHCESTVLLADDAVAETVLPRIDELGIDLLIADDASATMPLASLGDGPPLPWRDLPGHHDRSPALILYTSGSTGRPKGVVLPAGAFPSAGTAFNERFGFGVDDNYFLPLTMSHALGVVTAPAMAVMSGGAITLADKFSPTRFWQQVAQHRATASILFPTHLNLLLETEQGAPPADGNTLRLVITHAWNERFRTRFGAELALVWGMTETGAMCTGSVPGERVEREGYVGTPMIGVGVAIRDEHGETLGPEQRGEICLHHPHSMLEYLKAPEETGRTLVDGWVHSGDLGVLDESGGLYFLGRLKNVIKRSGENISAEEVENVVAAVPGVSECLVFGVPDPIRAEEVALVASVRDGTDADAILARAAESLVRWKLPRYLVITDQPLPRLGNGKLDRPAVRAAFDPRTAFDRERDAPTR